jgi:hypothetical protein
MEGEMNGPESSTDTTATAFRGDRRHRTRRRRAGATPARPARPGEADDARGRGRGRLVLVRALNERLNDARRALVGVQQRITFATADRYRAPVGLPELEAEQADAEQRVARLARDHEAAEARWTAASRLRNACKAYLGLTS